MLGLSRALACRPADPPPPPDATASAAPSGAPATGLPRSTARATTSAWTPGPSAALLAQFPTRERWPSGPGVVCSDTPCGKEEVCCSGTGECIPAANAAGCTTNDVVRCDESSDCPGAERCCSGLVDNGTLTTCATAERCARAWDRPGGFGLPAHEVCGRGGHCKDPAKVCVELEGEPSGGRCLSPVPRVACDGDRDCPADRPWCFWDLASHQAECVPRGSWYTKPGIFECDGTADCPGGVCCGGIEMSYCGTVECTPELAYAMRLCRSDRDCALDDGRQVPCAQDPRMPPGMGVCAW